jgi:hypothetical protein
MRKYIYLLLFFISLATITSCKNDKKPDTSNKESDTSNRDLEELKVQLAFDYTDLYKKYTQSFVNSLNTNLIENLISNKLLDEILISNIYIVKEKNDTKSIKFVITPYNYASLFRENMDFYYHKKIVLKLNKKVEKTFNQNYYTLKTKIKENIRKYMSNPKNINNFYIKKKHFILYKIQEEIVTDNEQQLFLLELDKCIKSFQLILDSDFRQKFNQYLKLESEFLIAANIEKRWEHGMQNSYDNKDFLFREVLDSNKILDTKAPNAIKLNFQKARTELFKTSKHPKFTAFAYRRYTEGGEKLLKEYINILKDLRLNLK